MPALQQEVSNILLQKQADGFLQRAYDNYNQSIFDLALNEFNQALQLYRQIGHTARSVECLRMLGEVHRLLKNHDSSVRFLLEAVQYFKNRTLVNPLAEAKTYRLLGWAYHDSDNYDQAINSFETARLIYQKLINPEGEANCYFGLGFCFLNNGDFQTAIARFKSAEAIFNKVNIVDKQLDCQFYISNCLISSEDYENAIDYLNRHLPGFTDVRKKARGWYWLGLSYLKLNMNSEAIAAYQQAELFFAQTNDTLFAAHSAQSIGEAYFENEEWQQAKLYFSKAAQMYQMSADYESMMSSLRYLGHANYNVQNYEQAAQAYQRGVEASRKYHLRADEAKALESLGDAYKQLKRVDEALVVYGQAADQFAALKEYEDAITNYKKSGNLLFNLGRYGEAVQAYRRAVRLAASSPQLQKYLAENRTNLADALRLSDQPLEALEEYKIALTLLRKMPEVENQLAHCLLGIGHAYFDLERYPEASMNFSQSAERFELTGDYQNAGKAYYNAGLSFFNIKEYETAIDMFLNALTFYKQVTDIEGQADCHKELALNLSELQRESEAKEEYNLAINLYDTIRDDLGKAACYKGLGRLFVNQKIPDLDAAKRYYKLAQSIYDAEGDKANWAVCLRGLARIDFKREKYELSAQKYQRAGKTFLNSGRLQEAALCFENVGNCHYNLKKYPTAISDYKNAYSYYTQLSDEENASRCQLELGDSNIKLYDLNSQENYLFDAWQNYEQALRYFNKVSDYQGIYKANIGMGDVYFERNQFNEAEIKYEEALKKAGMHVGFELEVHGRYKLAQCAYELLEFDKAMTLLDQIYNSYVQNTQTEGQLRILAEQAQIYRQLGKYETALQIYDKILELATRINNQKFIRIAKIDKANLLYLNIGEKEDSKKLYEEGLSLSKAAKDTSHITACLTGLANILFDEKNYEKALDNYQKVLEMELDVAVPDTLSITKTYINIGNVQKRLGYLDQAEQYYLNSKILSEEFEASETVAVCNNNLGTIDLSKGMYQEALQKFTLAEREAVSSYLKNLLITINANQGYVFEQMAKYDSASAYYEKSIKIVEEIRQELKQEKLIESFFNSNADLYDRMISLLFEKLDQPELAFDYIERYRSEGLMKYFKRKLETSRDLNLLNQLTDLENVFNRKRQNELKVQKLKAQGRKAQKKIQRLSRLIAEDTYKSLQIERNLLRDPEYPGMMEIRAAQVAAIQTIIPQDATVIMYYPANSKLYIYMAKTDRLITKSVDIGRDNLYALIRKYRFLIDDHMKKMTRAKSKEELKRILMVPSWKDKWIRPLVEVTTELHKYLIQPFKNDLVKGQTVIFIPAGLINYLPLHALAEEKSGDLNFVLQNWKVAYLTSTTFINSIIRSRVKVVPQESCMQNIVALGNSTGKLRGVDAEMNSLKQFAPQASIYLRFDATEELAKMKMGESCVFVVSDHCYVNMHETDKTYLLMAASSKEDGRLHTFEIEKQYCPSLDLAVLPNCQTAVGEENPVAGIRNLVHSFSVAGAISIIATLWPVSDFTTPQLLHEFYQNYFRLKLDKAESLRNAQLMLLKNAETRHPFFWAGFMLYGYWYQDVVQKTMKL